MKKIAVAVFVKTPGISPLKTRLAKDIGREKALEFYDLSWRSICAVIEDLKNKSKDEVLPYWSVADSGTREQWPQFEIIRQPQGSMGQRLHTIYHTLMQSHDAVILLGADAPQIGVDDLQGLIDVLAKDQSAFSIGLANDGGFYAFCGSKELDHSVWGSVKYSDSSTADNLIKLVGDHHKISIVEKKYSDVDDLGDLRQLDSEMPRENILPQQRVLQGWLQSFTAQE